MIKLQRLHLPMKLRPAPWLLACLGAAAALPAAGQDERGWYEVEAVVFTHENLAGQITERPLADPTRLDWLPRLRALQPAGASLAYPFEVPAPLVPAAEPALAASPQQQDVPAVVPPPEPEPVFGPLPAPASARGFRLADSSRDPWIALDAAAALLDQDVQSIENSPEHRVLWHATWRQPLLPARQAEAVLVQGGDRYGDRHEVEGSLRVSDSGGRVQLDAHLWFSSFLAGFASEGTAWTLPPLPEVALPASDAEITDVAQLGTWMSSGAWQLRDTRLLTTEAFHYLDNPAIGVLVQVRPYSVPPRELPAAEEDF